MLTHGGTHVVQGFGAPTVRDMAVQAMRLPRFGGTGVMFWPVGMHLLFVEDIVTHILQRPDLAHYAALHDCAETTGIGDICQPMKTDDERELEHRNMARIYRALGVRPPKDAEAEIVKYADNVAGVSEGFHRRIGPRGYRETHIGQPGVPAKPLALADGLLLRLLDSYRVEDALNPEGKWPLLLERRIRKAIRNSRSGSIEKPDKGL